MRPFSNSGRVSFNLQPPNRTPKAILDALCLRRHETIKTDFLEEVPLLLCSDFSSFRWALKGTYARTQALFIRLFWGLGFGLG